MEVTATFVAFFVSAMGLVRFYSRKKNIFLFIGAGFLGTGLLDSYHALITSSFYIGVSPSALPAHIPWSEMAPRLFLSLVLCLSWLNFKIESKRGKTRTYTIYLAIGLLTLASFLFFIFTPFPQTTYFPQLIFPQPQAFVSALLYLGALIGYWRKGEWRENHIEHMLMLSLIVGFIGEALFISSSSQLFDTLFNTAHILKLLSYIGILTGLLMSMFSIFRKAEASIEALSKAHAQLQLHSTELAQSNEALSSAHTQLQLHSTELAQANEALSSAHAQLQARSDELTQSNQDLETLLYVISHDLKEPLRAIESFSHLVNRRYAKRLDEKGQDFLRRIENAAKRLRTLINEILTLSQAQRMEGPSEEVASEVIVQEVLARLEGKVQETGVKMIIAPNLPQLQVNKLWATQAIYNLVSNALKYGIIEACPERSRRDGSHPPPEVEIAPYHGPEGTGLVIKDRGLGIPPKYREKIWVLFQRAVGREIEGTGAGLAIVRQIAQRHGGHAWVQPREGGGSEFMITFGPVK